MLLSAQNDYRSTLRLGGLARGTCKIESNKCRLERAVAELVGIQWGMRCVSRMPGQATSCSRSPVRDDTLKITQHAPQACWSGARTLPQSEEGNEESFIGNIASGPPPSRSRPLPRHHTISRIRVRTPFGCPCPHQRLVPATEKKILAGA